MDELYHLLRLVRSMRYGDILTAAIGVLAFVLYLRRRRGK